VEDAPAVNIKCSTEELHRNHESLFFREAANLIEDVDTFGIVCQKNVVH
jgi:hypothetical protein